jgi:hypothetical protein
MLSSRIPSAARHALYQVVSSLVLVLTPVRETKEYICQCYTSRHRGGGYQGHGETKDNNLCVSGRFIMDLDAVSKANGLNVLTGPVFT